MTPPRPSTGVRVYIARHGWEDFLDADAMNVRDTGRLTLYAWDHEKNTVHRTVAIFLPGAWQALSAAEGTKQVPIGFLREQESMEDQPERFG